MEQELTVLVLILIDWSLQLILELVVSMLWWPRLLMDPLSMVSLTPMDVTWTQTVEVVQKKIKPCFRYFVLAVSLQAFFLHLLVFALFFKSKPTFINK